MNYKILHENGKLIFKNYYYGLYDIYSTVDLLYRMSACVGIDCTYDVDKKVVTLSKNNFSKKYALIIQVYCYPETKRNIANDIKYCDEIIKDFVSSLKKTEYEIDVTDIIDNIKSLLTE